MRSPRLRRILAARHASTVLTLLLVAALPLVAWACAKANAAENEYPAASHVPASQKGWEKPDPNAPFDEPKGGMTLGGTPITKRTKDCFPAEPRNVFSEVDMVRRSRGRAAALRLGRRQRSDRRHAGGRDAIRGQNTWMLWGEGNEAFWGWLQEQGYGLVDFLILLDSRDRDQRFKNGGMINQPGMKAQTDPEPDGSSGLYLDEADGANIELKQPPATSTRRPAAAAGPPVDPHRPPYSKPLRGRRCRALPTGCARGCPRTASTRRSTATRAASSACASCRTPTSSAPPGRGARAPLLARGRRRGPSDAYYTDPRSPPTPSWYDPSGSAWRAASATSRRIPLNPPADPEQPDWANLSSIIGNQYWSPPQALREPHAPEQLPLPVPGQPAAGNGRHVAGQHRPHQQRQHDQRGVRRAGAPGPRGGEPAGAAERGQPAPAGRRRPDPRRQPAPHAARAPRRVGQHRRVRRARARVSQHRHHSRGVGALPQPVIGFKPQRPFST